jgi:lipoyl(octanoyl) transferase
MRDALPVRCLAEAGSPADAWRIAEGFVPYETAVAAMEERVAAIVEGRAPELVWLLEHPPLYTAGTSARPDDLVEARFPGHQTGRGGQFT